MFTSKYRWMAAFGTSIACHVVVFVVIGVVVALFPSAPVDKGPIQVDLVSLSGGGGGGGGSPDADNGPAIAPPSAEPTEVAPPPPALAEDMPEDAMNDIHEIADSVTESKEAATKRQYGEAGFRRRGIFRKSWVWQRYGFRRRSWIWAWHRNGVRYGFRQRYRFRWWKWFRSRNR